MTSERTKKELAHSHIGKLADTIETKLDLGFLHRLKAMLDIFKISSCMGSCPRSLSTCTSFWELDDPKVSVILLWTESCIEHWE